jgi:hypothetical protein
MSYILDFWPNFGGPFPGYSLKTCLRYVLRNRHYVLKIGTFVINIESMSYLCLKELILCPKGCLKVCLRYVDMS